MIKTKKQPPLHNYSNPQAKERAATNRLIAIDNRDRAATMRKIHSGKPIMGKNE